MVVHQVEPVTTRATPTWHLAGDRSPSPRLRQNESGAVPVSTSEWMFLMATLGSNYTAGSVLGRGHQTGQESTGMFRQGSSRVVFRTLISSVDFSFVQGAIGRSNFFGLIIHIPSHRCLVGP